MWWKSDRIPTEIMFWGVFICVYISIEFLHVLVKVVVRFLSVLSAWQLTDFLLHSSSFFTFQMHVFTISEILQNRQDLGKKWPCEVLNVKVIGSWCDHAEGDLSYKPTDWQVTPWTEQMSSHQVIMTTICLLKSNIEVLTNVSNRM